MEKNNSINSTVDIIKFIAAILVIFSHSFSLSSLSKDYLSLWINGASFGSFAVSIFFSFSGYYITKSILKSSDRFIQKRLNRLLPELIIVVIITVFIIGPLFTSLPIKDYFLNKKTYIYLINMIMIPYHNLPGVFINNISMSTVNGALWTLIVEFLCYIYIFVIYKLKLLNEKRILIVLIISVILSSIGFIVMKRINADILLAMIRPFLIFIVSSFLYFNSRKVTKKVFIISIILSAILLLFKNYICYDVFLILFVPLLLCFISNNIFMENKQISYLGKISYSMYLTGFVIQQCIISMFGGKMNSYLNFIISLPICIISSIIIYEFVNKLRKYQRR